MGKRWMKKSGSILSALPREVREGILGAKRDVVGVDAMNAPDAVDMMVIERMVESVITAEAGTSSVIEWKRKGKEREKK